jgi:multiple sugar transport system permease protein
MEENVMTTKLNLIVPGRKKDVRKTQENDKVVKVLWLMLVYAFLIFTAFLTILPFYYMFAASFMENDQILAGSFFPNLENFYEVVSNNYSETLLRFDYLKYVGNTVIVGLATTIGGIVITIISAFAFARLQFRGRDALFVVFLSTMMIPGEMMVITNYITMSNLGLIASSTDQTAIQSYLVMILPFLSSVFYIYLLRQNFKQIPNELYLAAKVDGKSDRAFLWKVMVPLASPTIITIVILNFIGTWNAYVWPKLVVNNSNYYLISVALRGTTLTYEIRPDEFRPMYNWQMAATVMTVVPLLILFIIFRKYIMRGIGRAGIKG